jgi:hypothetical protein
MQVCKAFHNLDDSPDIIRVIKSRRARWAGHVAHMGRMGNVYKLLVTKPKGKIMRGRTRHRWEGNIRADLRETGWEDVEGMHLAQDLDQWRVFVKTRVKLRVT